MKALYNNVQYFLAADEDSGNSVVISCLLEDEGGSVDNQLQLSGIQLQSSLQLLLLLCCENLLILDGMRPK